MCKARPLLYIFWEVSKLRLAQVVIAMLFGVCAFFGLLLTLLGMLLPGLVIVVVSMISAYAAVNY